ncbi:putative polyketide cyclase/dehydrase, START-like domain superfamily [Helianthus annuus]|nr:putative polyketide cyclase/dehydrase, START-like domain superfamily [Helianthus annuus]
MDAAQYIRRHHRHNPGRQQCASAVVKHIKAPVDIVWSLVRRFDQPQKYKPFVSRCTMRGGLNIGSVREVDVKSGLPATTSTERLELLDDTEHILGIKIVGGDHRLKNYSSILTVHPENGCSKSDVKGRKCPRPSWSCDYQSNFLLFIWLAFKLIWNYIASILYNLVIGTSSSSSLFAGLLITANIW